MVFHRARRGPVLCDGERGHGLTLGAILARKALLDFLKPLEIEHVEIAAHASDAQAAAHAERAVTYLHQLANSEDAKEAA